MDIVSVISILLVPAGILVVFLAIYSSRRETSEIRKTLGEGDPTPPPKSGYMVLTIFTIIVVLFGAFVLFTNWDVVKNHKDLITFGIGLFLSMIAGMFAQVIMSNYKAGRPLLAVSGSLLLYPVLISPIVFYVVWSSVASAPKGYFVVYCAFLNGYFWESTVSKVKPT